MPADLSAATTCAIALLAASVASRAVLASIVTPPSISAISGGADIVPSPVTEIVAGPRGGVWADSGVAINALRPRRAAQAKTVKRIWRILSDNPNVDGVMTSSAAHASERRIT